MIENIKYRKIDDLFNREIKEMVFGRINIIIGPKGGGKSTLFDLLANLNNNRVISSVVDAFESHQLEIISIKKDGEEIPFVALNKKTIKKNKKTQKEMYSGRNDVIYQADEIKENLSSSSELDKEKINFAKELILNSEDALEFWHLIESLYETIYIIKEKDNNNINWSNALKMSDLSREGNQIIYNLNYSSSELSQEINKNNEFLLSINNKAEENIKKYKNDLLTLNHFDYNLISDHYKKTLKEDLEKMIEINLKTYKMTKHEINNLFKLNLASKLFKSTYDNLISNLKNESSKKSNLKAYESISLNHFSTIGKLLFDAYNKFEKITLKDIRLNLLGKKPSGNLLDLFIDKQITLNEDDKYDILKTVLYNSKKANNNIANWIKVAKNNDGAKPLDKAKVLNKISSIIKKDIKVLAGGKDYDTMSLGQRSIYGIKYKFSHSIDEPLYLDQPEDNLDNFTIANDLVSMINERDKQVFIVTHNANVGVLTRPDKVIIANFNENEDKQNIDQYLVGKLAESSDEEKNAAKYLEGGIKFVEERIKILKGEDNEN